MAFENIQNVVLGLSSAVEIRKNSVVEIVSPKFNEVGSVYDSRMGSDTNNNIPCKTCGLVKECHGHFGHINLAIPILHPLFLKLITSILKCVCKNCFKILTTKEILELTNILKYQSKKRFVKMLECLEKTNKCPHCKSPQPKVSFKQKDLTIVIEYDKTENKKIIHIMSAEEIEKIFEQISDEDIVLLGFNTEFFHPRNLVYRALPVIPFCARPRVIAGDNFGDDDLTLAYNEILKTNVAIKKLQEEKPSNKDKKDYQDKYNKLVNGLNFRIQTMYDNSKGKNKNPDKRAMKCFKKRLSGKDGLPRNHINGKRNDYTARTVIGAGPHLDVDEVGVPKVIAETFTFPENVHEGNIEKMKELLEKGKINSVIRQGKRSHMKQTMQIRGTQVLYGDIIVSKNVVVKIEKGKVVVPYIVQQMNSERVSVLPFGWRKIFTTNYVLKEGERIVRNNQLIESKVMQKRGFEIKLGDVVERQLQNGDRVFLNRQPTLWTGSMQGLRVRIENYLTFKLNLGITKGFNAD